MEVKELNKEFKLSLGALIFIVVSTFTVTTIYNTFILQGIEIRQNSSDTKYFSDRADRRLENEIKIIQDQLDELRKPNSDSEQGNTKKDIKK